MADSVIQFNGDDKELCEAVEWLRHPETREVKADEIRQRLYRITSYNVCYTKLLRGLIRLAVSSARALGCRRFTARVQERNELLFRRQHWRTCDYCLVSGVRHAIMEADLHRNNFV